MVALICAFPVAFSGSCGWLNGCLVTLPGRKKAGLDDVWVFHPVLQQPNAQRTDMIDQRLERGACGLMDCNDLHGAAACRRGLPFAARTPYFVL